MSQRDHFAVNGVEAVQAERTRTSTPALSRWPDVADEPNPFRGSRFRSQGKAWARQISRPRSRMFELRPSHLTRPERGWRACPFFLSILLRLQGWQQAVRNEVSVKLGAKGRRMCLTWYLHCVCSALKIASNSASSHNGAVAELDFLLALFEQPRQEGR